MYAKMGKNVRIFDVKNFTILIQKLKPFLLLWHTEIYKIDVQ